MTIIENKPITSTNKISQNERIAKFLETKVHDLATHQVMAETGTMPQEMQQYYTTVMDKPESALLGLRPVIKRIAYARALEIYFSILGDRLPEKLGLHVSGSLVKIWAEIDESDEENWDELMLAGSRASFECASLGIAFETMCVDRTEGYTMPAWYELIDLN